jgi:hypothetical protein
MKICSCTDKNNFFLNQRHQYLSPKQENKVSYGILPYVEEAPDPDRKGALKLPLHLSMDKSWA